MSKLSMNREEAAQLFVRMLMARAYDGAIQATLSALESGPPGRKPSEDRIRRHRWFQSLDEQGREHVRAIAQEAVQAADFGSLVLLDGMTGGYPVQGQASDFALYLQIYADEDAFREDRPQESQRLNPNSAKGEDLHDIFKRILQERADQQS